MIWELEQCSERDHRRIASVLRHSPWLWPQNEDVIRVQWAERTVEGKRPELQPGQVLLITFHKRNSGVWILGGEELLDSGLGKSIEWGREAVEAWDMATLVVSQSLPVLWQSLREVRNAPRHAFCLSLVPQPGFSAVPFRILDGPSFGLSFLLAIVSRLFKKAVPLEFAASASLDSVGRVSRVGEIGSKIEALIKVAPRVTKLLVAAEQADEAREKSDSYLEIVPVTDAAMAIEKVFGDGLVQSLVHAGTDPEKRSELLDSFFRLAAMGRREVLDWTPVLRGAALALKEWGDELGPDDKYKLQFAHAVAGRHEYNQGKLNLPDPAWLKTQPLPLRVGLIAHIVQQSADTGYPSAGDVESVARAFIVADAREAYSPQLKLAGAFARLLAIIGKSEEALRIQEGCARAFFDGMEYSQVSYPLTEWFRLCGVCNNKKAFDRAMDLEQRVRLLGGLGLDGSVYVELACSKAIIMLHNSSNTETVDKLNDLVEGVQIPAHVRWSAARWLVKALDHSESQTDRAYATKVILRMNEVSRSNANDSTQAQIFLTLTEMDRALDHGDALTAQNCADNLSRLEPGPLKHITSAAKGGSIPAQISKFYPY
ncbi:MAG: hypothetical protein JW902_17210 [Syntrophaceae bacterium]|nr:hypothetical protein [Syntrophaceae bacterium]